VAFLCLEINLLEGVAGAELKKGGLVRGYGVAIKGKKKIRVL
jgi:hypothetical protein